MIFDDPAENERGQRPGSGSWEGKLSNPGGRAARAMHEFFLRKFTKSRAQLPRGFDAPVLSRSSLQYFSSWCTILNAVSNGGAEEDRVL